MRFLLATVSVSALLEVLLAFVLVLAVHTALAWGVATWLAKKSEARLAFGSVVAVFVAAFLICFATLSWMPAGEFNYSALQVFASGLAMVVLVVVSVYRLREVNPNAILVWWAAVTGYSLGWAVISGVKDRTGLWVAGLFFLVMGLTAGIGAVVALVSAFALSRRP
nr:hypothetical protein [Corynebacterium lactis]